MSSHERLIRQLMTNVDCAICGHSFQLSDVHVLGHEDQVWLLTTMCTHCHSHGIIIAILEIERPVPAHELSGVEETWFQDASLVGVDDVLEMHYLLEGFDGDLETLLDG